MFVNKKGYYNCYYSLDNMYPTELTNEWVYTTNHDTCWRIDAFVTHDIIGRIKDSILKICLDIPMYGDPTCPKHITPNFENIKITKGLVINTNKASCKNMTYHKLISVTNKVFKIVENTNDIVVTINNALLMLGKDEYYKYKQLETIGKTRGPNKCILYNPTNKTFK